MIQKLLDFLKKTKLEQNTDAPEGFCPNCWGRQEYGGKFYEAIVAEKINLNNIDQKKGWVQAYADKNLSGINLVAINHEKHEEGYDCPTCKLKYNIKK